VQVTDEGDVVLSQGAINGFLGGSVAPRLPQPPANRTRLPAGDRPCCTPSAPSTPPRHATTPRHSPRAPLHLAWHLGLHRHVQHPSRHPPRHPPPQVGAVGTLVATFVKRDQVKDRLKCPYCEGTGIIQCAHRLPSGTYKYACSRHADAMHIPCQVRAVPRQLTARLARREWRGAS